jgi:hypothetical protein
MLGAFVERAGSWSVKKIPESGKSAHGAVCVRRNMTSHLSKQFSGHVDGTERNRDRDGTVGSFRETSFHFLKFHRVLKRRYLCTEERREKDTFNDNELEKRE